MDINLKELRQLTKEAIEAGEKLRIAKENNDLEKEKLRHDEAKAWAESKLITVPEKCKDAASRGKNKVSVLDTRDNYDAYNTNGNNWCKFGSWNCKKSGLKYHYFCQGLEDAGLKYSVEYAHDGVGVRSWFEIIIKW